MYKTSNDQDGDQKNQTQLEEVMTLLDELKKGQQSLKVSLNNRISSIKTELLAAIDTKIEDIKTEIKEKIDGLELKLHNSEERMKNMEDHLSEEDSLESSGEQFMRAGQTEAASARMSKAVKDLRYRTLDQEARSRRNNILVFNVAETEDEDVGNVLGLIIRDNLKVTSEVAIQRVHLLGRPKRDDKPRAIIACLRDYPDVDLLFRNAKHLKGSKLSRDYPEEIRKARGRLEPARRKARRENKHAVIAYPAKLVVDKVVVKDEFEDWFTAMRAVDPTQD